MSIIEIILFVLFIPLFPLLGYQLILGIIALRSPLISNPEVGEKKRIAFIVPAHNEEKMISKTIYSLFGSIYPKNMYDTYIIADNCTDDTASISRSLGANVLERTHETKRGKGYALRWAFDQLLESDKNYDAFIVIDADSLISGNYLEVMNYYLQQGSKVVQSSDLVLPEPGNWSVESTRIGFMLYNYVKPLGRKVLNLDMGLRGNGMCFSTDVLRDVPWQAWSLTEDVEYGMILLLNDYRIDFAPEASVLAQMPVDAVNAESQRSRWEMGRYQIIREYTGKFLRRSFTKKSARSFDVFIDLITPPFVNMMLVVSFLFMISVILWLTNIVSYYSIMASGSLLLIGLIYLFVGLYVANAEKELYTSLFRLPFYVLWKVKLYIKTFFTGKEENWVRTERDL